MVPPNLDPTVGETLSTNIPYTKLLSVGESVVAYPTSLFKILTLNCSDYPPGILSLRVVSVICMTLRE